MNTTQYPRMVRLLGSLCCLAILFSYRPETQAEEKTPKVAPPVESPAEPVLQRTQSVFRTASYLQGKSILVPPAPADYASQNVADDTNEVGNQFDLPATEVEASPAVPADLPQETVFDDNWSMSIVPGNSGRKQVDPSDYNKIYQKIPFRRSEYLANPSYRHDATMEIMFGELRPTVNHRTTEPQIIHNPRPRAYQDNQFLSNDYWRYHPPALRYFNRYMPMHY